MTKLWAELIAHPYVAGLASLWLFSAFTGGMPEPDASSGKAYRWTYNSLHLLAANLDKIQLKKGV
jgi:hypothetical protein